ncbi:MAG: NADP-dependent oxidoreductase [Acidobacteria bacterium]|nr:NADP-dependent oxidoreductase [Acidobacteriota bacterium]
MNEQWLLAARPVGLPKESDFTWRRAEQEEPGAGQFRVRSIYLSLDPAMRGWMARDSYQPAVAIGAVMRGIGVGVVDASNHTDFAVGALVQGMLGWQTYCISDGKGMSKLPALPVPLDAWLGLLGHIGLTAYFGLLEIGQPKAGETLVVSAAAGAVGSVVGQIGKIKGCRVVGIAGSGEKCRWITEELGFDAAINYKAENLHQALKRECPGGIDIYFENVGGKTLETVLNHMNNFSRIPVCGMISGYNQTELEPGPGNLFQVIVHRVKMQGFIVTDFMSQARGAVAELAGWYAAGSLKYRVDVTKGLENAPAALLKLFDGTNQGKMLVQVSEEN